MTQWLEFWQQVLPSMVKFGQKLYEEHKGDVSAARAELRTITDQRGRRAQGEEAVDAKLRAAAESTRIEMPSPGPHGHDDGKPMRPRG
jgi:hypothetical protein